MMSLGRFRRSARWVLLLSLPGFVGCFTYVPAEIGGPVRGVVVRTEVQGRPTLQVGDRTVREVTRVDGEVIVWEPDTLALSAIGLYTIEQGFPGEGYTVRLAVNDLLSLSVKRLDKRRTFLLGLGTAVAALVAQQSLGGGSGTGDNPPGGGEVH